VTIDKVELKMMAVKDPMNKLGRLISIFKMETKEQRKKVVKKFWKVVRGFRSCNKKIQNQ